MWFGFFHIDAGKGHSMSSVQEQHGEMRRYTNSRC